MIINEIFWIKKKILDIIAGTFEYAMADFSIIYRKYLQEKKNDGIKSI